MDVRIAELDLASVLYVVKNMRKQDWLEISNLVPRSMCDVESIAMFVKQSSTIGFVVHVDGKPALVFQMLQKHEGCWSAGLFATDDFVHCWRAALKHIKAAVIPYLIDCEARYCEAMVMADNRKAKALLELIGFKPLSKVLTNYGAFGKDFQLYAITEWSQVNHVFDTRSTQNRKARSAD